MSWFTDIQSQAAAGAGSGASFGERILAAQQRAAATAPPSLPDPTQPVPGSPTVTATNGGPTTYAPAAGTTYQSALAGLPAPTDPTFQYKLNATSQAYGFNQGDQGYSVWDPNRQIVETQGGYLTYENGAWKFNPTSPETGSNPTDSTLANFGLPSAPYASQPFGETYQTPPIPDVLKTPYVPGNFQAPTLSDLQASPGYQARELMGEQGVQRNASAQGDVLSGGTLKALENYRQDYASNEYSNLYGQRLGAFQTNESANLNARQQNAGEYQNLVADTNQAYTNRYNAYLGENARTLNDYLTNYGVQHQYATDWWAQQNQIANRGLQAASNSRPS